ncbi:MAG: Holliday junction DNA helicase RuvA [Candidatus Melainabacteria bacterium GWA2_34_9]|nr:MAG: Holliday junction DNA helicase RuvA [Candidatus Melainabacteria bacterium GWA2_34_9]
MSYKRYLGLDVGTKRIGSAISDPLAITAQPLKVISRLPENKAIEEIKKICNEYNVETIIAGLPKNMDGTLGFQAEDVMTFVEKITAKIGIEVKLEDERLTSKAAERYLIEQNKKPSKNRGLIDITSAILILQQYLDKRSK